MPRATLLSTRTVDFGELVGNGKVYRVPPYQRDYSWTEEQWEDLWTDIVELGAGDSHYMGAIVVEAVADREFRIIDGQQRAATLSILALAVIARLQALADRGVDATDNRERAMELRRAFIGERNPASLVESSKLFLNEADDPFYQDYLVQLRQPANVRRFPRSNRLLWECYEFFRGRLATVDSPEDGAALARLLNDRVARQLMFIAITVDDEMNAYTVFETLNARGLELTTTDLLKNYLFSKVKVQADLDMVRRRWQSLVTTVTPEKVPEFLRYHYQTTEPRVRSNRLFKLVRDRTKRPEDVLVLLDSLEDRAELFSALKDPSHAFWSDSAELRGYVRETNLFQTQQFVPLLFAAYERFDRARFTSVVRMVAVTAFRYSVVSDLNTNAIELPVHRAAKAILDGSATNPASVAQLIAPVYVEDQKFAQDFSLLTLPSSGQRRRLTKYVLSRLESDASGRSVDPETDPGTVEHILPVNPDPSWEEFFSAEEQERVRDRLGNLTLLAAGPNREAENRPFRDKLKAYAASGYEVTRAIPVLAPTEWTAALVESRQRQMAHRAVQIWRVDY